MSTRFAWLLGVVVLVSIGLLVACGTTYNASSDGLVLVGSQGSAAIQTFSFDLGNGHVSAVTNSTSSTVASTCLLPGLPSSIVLDPTGTFAYAILTANSACQNSTTGIIAFKVNSDGTMTAGAAPVPLNPENAQVCETISKVPTLVPEVVPVVPVALTMDSSGKYLFVADSFTTDGALNLVPGAVSVFAVGSGGGLTEVTNPDPTKASPYTVPASCLVAADPVALAVTPTVFPGLGLSGQKNAVCSGAGNNPPTVEYLYLVDKSTNNGVWEFDVEPSTGVLSLNSLVIKPAGALPSGVSVDPCNRFVYVANKQSNTISAYSICNGMATQSSICPVIPDGSLVDVVGSPFSISANGPGPLVVDPFGNTLYVVGTLSSNLSVFRISPVSGSLTAGNPAFVATGLKPTSIAIRSDDSWLFVTNHDAGTMSQYSVTPATGSLSPQPAVTTDNYPWGVAVK